ncbi:MAG TPA: CBS domain-containing protein [Thiobacillaceae bacterium]|nr:CBS domain-containing protein [Thiobacillaceae bacterium]
MTIEAIPLSPLTDTVSPELSLADALRRMLKHNINNIAVCDLQGRWLGLLNIVEILGQVLPVSARVEGGLTNLAFAGDASSLLTAHIHDLKAKHVGDAMRTDLPVLGERHPLLETALLLYRHEHPLPVVGTDGRLRGMLSRRALLAYLADKGGLA